MLAANAAPLRHRHDARYIDIRARFAQEAPVSGHSELRTRKEPIRTPDELNFNSAIRSRGLRAAST